MAAQTTIRAARVEDAGAIARVHVETWKIAYKGIVADDYLDALSVPQRTDVWRDLLNTDRTNESTWVGESASRIVGFAAAGPSRDADAFDRTGELFGLYVEPAHWDTGFGAALVNEAIARLADVFSTATLWVLERNERGRRFYEKGGWRPDGASQPLERLGGLVEVRYRLDL